MVHYVDEVAMLVTMTMKKFILKIKTSFEAYKRYILCTINIIIITAKINKRWKNSTRYKNICFSSIQNSSSSCSYSTSFFNATRELKSSISTIGTLYLAFIVLISSVICSKISSC